MDRTSVIRGRVSLELAEPLLVPTGPQSRLGPYGAEVAVYRGITYTDGTTEVMPWGVFGIQTSVATATTMTTRIDGLDRFKALADAALTAEMKITAGTNGATAIVNLIAAVNPKMVVVATPCDHTLPETVIRVDDDIASRIVEMAQMIGFEIFMDHAGTCVLQPEPVASDPVASLTIGAAGTVTDLRLTLDRGNAVNQVTVIGKSTTATTAVKATATDTNPLSPTCWGGPFGRKPLKPFITNPLLATTAQAQAVADARLARSKGVPKVIELDAVPNPAIQASDAVIVNDGRLVFNETHVIDRVVMPLGVDGTAKYGTRMVLA